MSTIFFIHLPKTGGTSIRHAAREQFPPEQVLMLYGKTSQWTSPAAFKIVHGSPGISVGQRMNRLSDHIVANGVTFFASHLSAAHLPCFDPDRAFTILRDPVDRVISEYHFFRQKGRTKARFDAFIEHPDHRNVQHRKLASVELESLAVVGVLEDYAAFLERLNSRFGLSFGNVHRKRGRLLKQIHSRFLRETQRRRIERLNEEDIEIYRRAVEIARR